MKNSENKFDMGKPNPKSELVELTCPGDPGLSSAGSLADAVNQKGLTEHRPLRPQEFNAWFEAEAPKIFRQFKYKTGRKEDAEDLLQDVFLRGWTKMRDGEFLNDKPGGYLWGIANNLWKEFSRNRKKRSGEVSMSEFSYDGDDEPLWEEDRFLPPAADEMAEFESKDLVDQLLGGLTREQKESVEHFMEEKRRPSGTGNTPEARASRKHLYFARKKLKSMDTNDLTN